MFDERVFDERVVCVWSAGLTGKSEGLDKTLPEKTQHWFGKKALAASFASGHDAKGNTVRDFYQELVIGDAVALGEGAREAGIDEEQSLVGYGSFAVVRAAQHKASRTQVVLKIAGLDDAGRDYYRRLVEADGCHYSLLCRHPNIVQSLDYLLGENHLFVAMRPLKGQELDEFVVTRFPLDETLIQIIMRQAALGLQYVHSQNVMHRDVKNESFRFEGNDPADPGKLVLLDFGFASFVSDPKREVLGTVPYMAPEVSSKKYGLPVDMWSLGVVLYTLVTGNLPFEIQPMHSFVVGEHERECALSDPELSQQSHEALHFLAGLLTVDAGQRLTADQALQHDWLCGVPDDVPPSDGLCSSSSAKYQDFVSQRKSVQFRAARQKTAAPKRGFLSDLVSLACCSKR